MVMAAAVACGNGAPKRPEKTMNGDVAMKVVRSVADQPADAVAWGATGIVSADARGVSVWRGDQPDRTLALDGNTYGAPKSITLLADGGLGVAAARFDHLGKPIGDPDALAAALVAGLPAGADAEAMGYRVLSAAWSPDGTRLWLGVEQRPRRGQSGALPEPHARTLVLDDRLALVADVSADEGTAWQAVVARGDTVVTAGGPLSIWKGAAATRVAKQPGPPIAIALSADGTRVVTADHAGVHVATADGKELARWTANDPSGVAISSTGAWVATAGNAAVQLWRVDGDKATLAAEAAIEGVGFAVAFAPDDEHLAVGSSPRRVTVLAIAPK